MASILNKITTKIKSEENTAFLSFGEENMKPALRSKPIDILPLIKESFFVIAEVKKASPSKGIIREDFKPVEIAKAYVKGGASAISVITETYFFQGAKEYLTEIKNSVKLPVLRKDFIINAYQVYESFNLGADLLLLIAACLSEDELRHLYELTRILGMNAIVEVHNREELEKTLNINPSIIGINNRDLNTFITDIKTSFELKKLIPEGIHAISESGIKDHNDISQLKEHGFSGALIGESLLRQENLSLALRKLING